MNKQSGFAAMWVFVVIAVLVMAGGGYLIYINQQVDEETTDTTQTQIVEEIEEEPEETPLPDGFVLFEDPASNIRLAYPENWGTAELVRDDFSHDGESYYFIFSNNESIWSGTKTADFEYTDGPRGGMGATGFGHTSFEEHIDNVVTSATDHSATIIEQSDSHILYADFDMMSGDYFLSLSIRLEGTPFVSVELLHRELLPAGVVPDEGIETLDVMPYVDEAKLAELQAIANANLSLRND